MDQKKLDQQSQYWEKNFSSKPEMFGYGPSYAAKESLKIFKKKKITKIVELGAGLGRDTIFFAKNKIKVHAVDYSKSGIRIINEKAKKNNLNNFISTELFDVRKKFLFQSNSFQACYSHMLYCMAITNTELENLNQEIYRILISGGINIYTIRNIEDGDYKKGIHIGENIYENDGFLVHFFSENKIKKLSKNFKILNIKKFKEGKFPRKLYFVNSEKI